MHFLNYLIVSRLKKNRQLKQVQGKVEALRKDIENLAKQVNRVSQQGKSITKALKPLVKQKPTIQRGKLESNSFVKA